MATSNRVDLGEEFVDDDSWDDLLQPTNWPASSKGYSAGSKLGLIADYSAEDITDSSETVSANVMVAAHDYSVGYQGRYVDQWADLWGFVHRYPRFWAAEPLIMPSLFGDRPLVAIYSHRPTLPDIASRFARDRDAWLAKSATMSSVVDMAMLPEYQRIIGLGADALPLIIDELRNEVDHWFWALISIVGEDHAIGAETLPEAANKWIEWFDSRPSDE